MNDKVMHVILGLILFVFGFGVTITLSLFDISVSLFDVVYTPADVGFRCAIIGGLGKEVIWDWLLKKGTPEWLDAMATISGGLFLYIASHYLQSPEGLFL